MLSALRTDVHAMCVGPVTARPLVRLGVPTSAPERMRLGALARHITDELPLLQSRTMQVAGHLLEIRGTCVMVDGAVKELSPAGMATIRALAHRPGRVVCADRSAPRPSGHRHRHPRGGDRGIAPANGVGRQEHCLDRGQARLSVACRRTTGVRAMSLLLVAHGTRKPAGVAMVGDLAERVSVLLNRQIHVAFVDVIGPTPQELLEALPADRPVTVVPAFLASGYHVRVDLPAHVAASGHQAVTVTAPLGPCPHTVQVMAQRLVESGWRPGDSVVMAAAGTSDAHALSDLRHTAALLSAVIGDRVELAFAATGEPRVPTPSPSYDDGAHGASCLRHTCWRTGCFKIGSTKAALTW